MSSTEAREQKVERSARALVDHLRVANEEFYARTPDFVPSISERDYEDLYDTLMTKFRRFARVRETKP